MLQIDEQVDIVQPVVAAIQEGRYDAARALLNQIKDEQLRLRVRYTVATKTHVYL